MLRRKKNKDPLDGSCQAEYEDGYILDETEHNDESVYDPPTPNQDGIMTGSNIFSDILNKRPETDHGRMVRFTVFYKGKRHDIDWTMLPDNARPIRFRDMSRRFNIADMAAVGDKWINAIRFGFQYTDRNGKNQEHIMEAK